MVATVGIDLGGSKLLAVRVEDGQVAARELFASAGEDLLVTAKAAIRELWTDDVVAIGAGIAGLVRYPEGIFVGAACGRLEYPRGSDPRGRVRCAHPR